MQGIIDEHAHSGKGVVAVVGESTGSGRGFGDDPFGVLIHEWSGDPVCQANKQQDVGV